MNRNKSGIHSQLTRWISIMMVMLAIVLPLSAQRSASQALSLPEPVSQHPADSSNFFMPDRAAVSSPASMPSAAADSSAFASASADSTSLAADSTKSKTSDISELTEIITFESADSLTFSASGTAHLYKDGKVLYGELDLSGGYIVMNMDSSTIFAVGLKDSVGNVSGNPVFTDKSGSYESRDLKYNFVSQKGIISDVVTQQGEGYVVSGRTKKMDDDAMFMTDGKYTTCEDHEHPHFYLQLSKAKVRPGKNIVTGPAHLVVEDVHLPLVVPFGFFPFSSEYSSGIITPTYGDEMSRGFYLRDGGYYFAVNDYFDLALTGEYYTKGSWGVKARSNYRQRYKFSGNLAFSYLLTANSEKGLPDYSESSNMSITWSHAQDAKANPYRSFSASVNFATSGYSRNDLNSYYNPDEFAQNTKSSSINFSQRFPDFPLSISASASITQRSKDSTLTVSLPNMSLSVPRFYPFKRKEAVGKERFYEKISMSYSGTLANSISEVKEYEILNTSIIKDWRNGMKHSIPVSATFTMLNYINITPSFSYTERWYTNRTDKYYDPELDRVMNDTIWGFHRVWDYNASVSASTKLYGYFQPLPQLFGTKVNMIRHVLTPSVSFSYRPDFGDERYGYYETLEYVDAAGKPQELTYSRYQNSLYGTPGKGKSGSINFNVANNLEMKVRNDKDTTEENSFKKVSLIDNFSFGTSYNLAADSLNWSNISANIRIKFGPKYTLNLSGSFDPYTYQLNSAGNPVRVNVTQFEKNGIPGRLVSTGTSFSYTINNQTFQKKEKKEGASAAGDSGGGFSADGVTDGTEGSSSEESKPVDPEEALYKPYTIPWSFSLSYTLRYARADFDKERLEYNRKLTHNLSFNGNLSLTDKWKLTASSSYNFDTKQLSTMNCTVSRDLHCWVLSASFIPIGRYKSYNFSIRVKSGMLQDLKYEQRQNPRDNVVWGVR